MVTAPGVGVPTTTTWLPLERNGRRRFPTTASASMAGFAGPGAGTVAVATGFGGGLRPGGLARGFRDRRGHRLGVFRKAELQRRFVSLLGQCCAHPGTRRHHPR